MIWNLCEIEYDCSKFDNQVLKMGFIDHFNAPINVNFFINKKKMIFFICKSIDSWLTADKSNVAVIHCRAGKGRTGKFLILKIKRNNMVLILFKNI